MNALVFLICFTTLVSSTIVPPASEFVVPSSPGPDILETPEPFLVESVMVQTPKLSEVPIPQTPPIAENLSFFVVSPTPSPEPAARLLITCRDGSCRGKGRMFSCRDENGGLNPKRGRATLLLTSEISRFNLRSHYRANVPALFIDWGFLWFIPWRSTTNGRSGEVSCDELMAFGTPFGFSSGSCCNACSFTRQRSGPPRLLCCQTC